MLISFLANSVKESPVTMNDFYPKLKKSVKTDPTFPKHLLALKRWRHKQQKQKKQAHEMEMCRRKGDQHFVMDALKEAWGVFNDVLMEVLDPIDEGEGFLDSDPGGADVMRILWPIRNLWEMNAKENILLPIQTLWGMNVKEKILRPIQNLNLLGRQQ